MTETYLSMKQAAEMAGVSYAALRREITSGRIPACRVGRKYFVSRSSAENYRDETAAGCTPDGYTIREVMEILPLSYAFIIDLIKKKKLPARKCGRRYIIPTAALEQFIAASTHQHK